MTSLKIDDVTNHIDVDSVSKGNRQVKNPRAVSKRVASSLFASFSLFNGKRLSIKVFLEVTLVSLTLRARTVFSNFNWFALQQQFSTSRRQKFDLFYPKLSVEFNELSLKF